MATAPHSRILADAARAVLEPMGLLQQGRSRTWLDDHGWWVCIVAFESSSFSKGTYLAVAADFLWNDRDRLAFAVGGRLADPRTGSTWVAFEDEDQFAPAAMRLARRAADVVLEHRAQYRTLVDWADALAKLAEPQSWRSYDAAVAAGLAGREAKAHRYFEMFAVGAGDDEADWFDVAARRARRLDALLDDRARFERSVGARVKRFRAALRLPATDVTFQ